jgi:hypothetical protein
MQSIEILRELQKRIPWSSMKTILQSNNISFGNGWDATIGKISESILSEPNEEIRVKNILSDYFEKHILCSEKAVSFYQVDNNELATLCESIRNTNIDSDVFGRTYPFPLSSLQLKESAGTMEITRCSLSNTQLKVVICSSRYYEASVQLELGDLTNEAIEEHSLQGFSEIVAKKKLIRQFYDIISIDLNTGLMQLRMDYGLGVSPREFLKATKQVKDIFSLYFGKILRVAPKIDGPINLFPLVSTLYDNATEARVCELGFTTNSGSVKLEKMRRQPIDLRSEAYHCGGKEAVDGQLSIYRIALTWILRDGQVDESQPELLLAGRLKCLSDPTDFLKNAIFSKILDERDYNFLIDEIVSHLNDAQ